MGASTKTAFELPRGLLQSRHGADAAFSQVIPAHATITEKSHHVPEQGVHLSCGISVPGHIIRKPSTANWGAFCKTLPCCLKRLGLGASVGQESTRHLGLQLLRDQTELYSEVFRPSGPQRSIPGLSFDSSVPRVSWETGVLFPIISGVMNEGFSEAPVLTAGPGIYTAVLQEVTLACHPKHGPPIGDRFHWEKCWAQPGMVAYACISVLRQD